VIPVQRAAGYAVVLDASAVVDVLSAQPIRERLVAMILDAPGCLEVSDGYYATLAGALKVPLLTTDRRGSTTRRPARHPVAAGGARPARRGWRHRPRRGMWGGAASLALVPPAHDALAVLVELGIRPRVRRWTKPARARGADEVELTRRRFAFPGTGDRTDDVTRALDGLPQGPREFVTVSWDHSP